MNTAPLADPVLEADRILAAAEQQGVVVRLIGGLAVQSLAQIEDGRLTRAYKDIDLVALKGQGKAVTLLMEALGYRGNMQFNTMQGHERLLFYDDPNQRQVDVFIGAFQMCHRIPITERVTHHARTVPPAELLLTKLQVFNLNEKDLRDLVQLLLGLELEESASPGADSIDLSVVARLCANDWGLWRTSQLNLERIASGVATYGLDTPHEQRVLAAVAVLQQRLNDEPKSRAWRLRDRVGDRKQWYEDPEEIGSA